ncbi:hypothetical protein GMSM_40430 [Geomonas sp. Red276]
MSRTDARLSAQLLAVDIISQLLASAAPQTLGELLTEQLRELTGARTVMLVVHDKQAECHEILSVSPRRRLSMVTAGDVPFFCPGAQDEDLPRLVEHFPEGHPAKAVLKRAGIRSQARYPLIAGRERVGMLLLFDLPEIDRIGETDEIIHLLAPPIALALNNSMAFRQIERQAIALENQVAIRTEQLLKKNAELERAENLHRAILQSTMEGFWLIDSQLKIVNVNEAYCAMSGYCRDELIGMPIDRLDVNDSKDAVEARARKLREAGSGRFESEHRRKDGSIFPVEVSVSSVPVEDVLFSVFVKDISEHKLAEEALRRSEEQLRQSQKMEAVGQLAGGVAHDFNNILMVVAGYCSLLQGDDSLSEKQKSMVDAIASSAEKAGNLTRGLLAFSRKQALVMKHDDLNDIIQHVQTFLERIIGEDITFNVSFCEGDLPVTADRGRLEQVLINLATNARDAIGNGGVVSVKTERVVLEDSLTDSRKHNVSPGAYALLTVSDTGAGIRKEHLEHIFEPFFTTKEVGKGTGLGMAITYGIIKQHKGFINVYSEPGRGTTFRIYLPLKEGEGKPVAGEVRGEPPRRGSETILVAEDDPAVRELVSQVLRNHGYETILAEDGEDAVAKFKDNQERIGLIIMDVIMPKKNGKEAFEEIQRISPATRALFSSGYTADFIEDRGVSENGIELIMKPVQPTDLLRRVREMLDV